MYKVTVQSLSGTEKTIYYPTSDDHTLVDAILSLKVGSAGEFNFTVPLTNACYSDIAYNAIITIYEDFKEIWRGDIRDIDINFDKSLVVYALEDLAWLSEEAVDMVKITNQTYGQRFQSALATYNSNQTPKRQFTEGVITAVTSTDTCSWAPKWEENLLDCLREYIAKDGYVRIRREYSGNVLTRYVDIVDLSDYGVQATQEIAFGSNLLDFVKEIDTTNFLNVLYPFGAETDNALYNDEMVRLEGTPIQNDESISAFGRRARSVVFETDSLNNLNRLATAYLSRYSQPSMKIQVKAVDLGNIELVNRLHVGDSVRVVAHSFGIDQWNYITKQDLDLLNIANNQIELSDSVQVRTLTSQVIAQAEEIDEQQTPASLLNSAKQNAISLLEGEEGGIITFVLNNDGQMIEQRILNNLDYEQATKAWRWTLGGLAYLHRTYPSDNWTVGVAITMDGQIVADYITTGTLNANNVRVVGKIEATSGYIGNSSTGWNIGASSIYNGPTTQANTTTQGTYIGTDGIRQNGPLGATISIKDGQLNCNSNVTTGSLNASFVTCGGLSIQNYDASFSNNGYIAYLFPAGSYALVQYPSGGGSGSAYVAWQAFSDKRLKENIKPIDTEFIHNFYKAVNPVKFNFINDKDKKTEFGLIAQDLEEVLEEVGEDNTGFVLDIQGYKAINYEKVVGLIIPAVKDLYEIVERQQATIESLQAEIKILKEERNG